MHAFVGAFVGAIVAAIATTELSDITARFRPVIATVADPRDPRDISVGRILRFAPAQTSPAQHANS
jgi:hypothetical protein